MNDELIALQLYKDAAIEAMADNDRVIAEQKKRIDVLEFHLSKLRDLIFMGYRNTSGVVPLEFDPDVKAKVKKATRKALQQ